MFDANIKQRHKNKLETITEKQHYINFKSYTQKARTEIIVENFDKELKD